MYERGVRYSGPYFRAFYLLAEGPGEGPKIGFTAPRSLGGAVVRNRIKRRVREAVRLGLKGLTSPCQIVFNPRPAAKDAPFPELRREVEQLFRRCVAP